MPRDQRGAGVRGQLSQPLLHKARQEIQLRIHQNTYSQNFSRGECPQTPYLNLSPPFSSQFGPLAQMIKAVLNVSVYVHVCVCPQGQWRGGVHHGEGTISHSSGASYTGMWTNGSPAGLELQTMCTYCGRFL